LYAALGKQLFPRQAMLVALAARELMLPWEKCA